MSAYKFIFLLMLAGCASNGVPRSDAAKIDKLRGVPAISFAYFIKSVDTSAERGAISPYFKQGHLNGDGFTVFKAGFAGTRYYEYHFDDHMCVAKPELTMQLGELGYAEIKDRLPSSERSLDSYAIYSKPRARVNVDFSINNREQCLLALFIKYK